MNKLTETERAYLAGVLDCDGCIRINRQHSCIAFISQSDRGFLEYWQRRTGVGRVRLQCRAGLDGYKRDFFRWTIRQSELAAFLGPLFPFAMIKYRQMGIALRFLQFKVGYRARHGYHHEKGGFMWHRREYFRIAIADLKQWRPDDTELPSSVVRLEKLEEQWRKEGEIPTLSRDKH